MVVPFFIFAVSDLSESLVEREKECAPPTGCRRSVHTAGVGGVDRETGIGEVEYAGSNPQVLYSPRLLPVQHHVMADPRLETSGT